MKELKDAINALAADRRTKIETRAKALIAEEMTLRDLRRAQDLTQERMAELLGVGQNNISRLGGRADMLLSTLRSYIAAMGGSLDLIVRFPDWLAVSLAALFDNEEKDKGKVRRKRTVDKHTAGCPA
ncbi:helix-turn-helix domain-containing protein [Candidatus Thiosymbion oneisti]|uniref:helix-turn-helix domain-containing protein n=1 Tax=Candidatus Thiosymbion oneisti TaxID=589554 RepID=UPI000AAFF8F9|nr:XRE family transcriptional regulator [Candidatus Thiosymbion oneisti]